MEIQSPNGRAETNYNSGMVYLVYEIVSWPSVLGKWSAPENYNGFPFANDSMVFPDRRMR